jgi:hypothetical protein
MAQIEDNIKLIKLVALFNDRNSTEADHENVNIFYQIYLMLYERLYLAFKLYSFFITGTKYGRIC